MCCVRQGLFTPSQRDIIHTPRSPERQGILRDWILHPFLACLFVGGHLDSMYLRLTCRFPSPPLDPCSCWTYRFGLAATLPANLVPRLSKYSLYPQMNSYETRAERGVPPPTLERCLSAVGNSKVRILDVLTKDNMMFKLLPSKKFRVSVKNWRDVS